MDGSQKLINILSIITSLLGVEMAKVAVFLDGGYLTAIMKQLGEPIIDYECLTNKFCQGDEERLRTYYYGCMPYQSSPPTDEERERYRKANQFFYNLKKYPRFEIRFGRLRRFWKNGNYDYEQKRVDVLLSVDLVRMSWARQIERAIVVTADSDFVPAIQAAKEALVVTRLWYYPDFPLNNELLEAFDERCELTKKMILSCAKK